MTKTPHDIKDLEKLSRISTPTISNAIETFGVRPNNHGFMNPDMKSRFPDLGVMVGYATTVRVVADQPPSEARPAVPGLEYWEFVAAQPGPKVAVVQDLDPWPVGSLWGEVNTNIHKALGCVGTVTQGGVRDLPEMQKNGFHTFSTAVLVSHAHVHYVDYGGAVRVGGIVVRTGDLLHADGHGVLVIPPEIPLPELISVADKIESLEQEVFDYCQSDQFTPQGLEKLFQEIRARRPKADAKKSSA
jgi:regulator of RNase E activity RraA